MQARKFGRSTTRISQYSNKKTLQDWEETTSTERKIHHHCNIASIPSIYQNELCITKSAISAKTITYLQQNMGKWAMKLNVRINLKETLAITIERITQKDYPIRRLTVR